MTCPNCQSQDIITVQDQLFCVGCGRTLSKNDIAQAEAMAPKAVALAVKRGPGRPKATRLDAPVIISPSDDLAPEPVVQTIAAPPAPIPTVVRTAMPHRSLVWGALTALRPFMILATLPATVTLAAVGGYSWYLSTRSPLPSHYLISVIMAGVAVALSLIWFAIVQTAVIFHRAGVHDHRLQRYRTAWRAAIGAWPRVALLQVMVLAAETVVLGGLAAVVRYGGSWSVVDSTLRFGLIFAACFALIIASVGLWVMLPLAIAARTLGNCSVWSATVVAWHLSCRHPEVIGIRLAALTAWSILLGASGSLIVVATHGHSATIRPSLLLATAFLVVGARVVAGAGAAEAGYRYWLSFDSSAQAAKLLSSRSAPKRIAPLATGLIVIAALTVSGTVAAIVLP